MYNRCWGREYHSEAFPVVRRLLLSNLTTGSDVLDVCCGTGQFTYRVSDSGFHVTGIDASEEMLYYARENVPDGVFYAADVRDFSLGRRFRAAYSVFESLNHVPDLNGLTRAFGCIHQHLEKGAPFLFDLNGEHAFECYWNDTNAIVESDMVCVLRSEYNSESRIARCQITLFQQDKSWERNDFMLQQTCHPLNQVHAALESSGFDDIVLYNAQDLGMNEAYGYDRTFFLAKA
jgi:SAM-dependent methyltransferase